jgi:hypothetical protein
MAAVAATVLMVTIGGPSATAHAAGAPNPTPVKPQGGTFDPHKVRWISAKPIKKGRYLRITWWSGVAPCWVLDRVKVKETAKKVTVTLYEGRDKDAGMCILVAVKKTTIVKLKTPLGNRKIVDGAR